MKATKQQAKTMLLLEKGLIASHIIDSPSPRISPELDNTSGSKSQTRKKRHIGNSQSRDNIEAWTEKNNSRKRKVSGGLSEAIREAVTLNTPEIRDEVTGTVIKEQAIRDIHQIAEAEKAKLQ